MPDPCRRHGAAWRRRWRWSSAAASPVRVRRRQAAPRRQQRPPSGRRADDWLDRAPRRTPALRDRRRDGSARRSATPTRRTLRPRRSPRSPARLDLGELAALHRHRRGDRRLPDARAVHSSRPASRSTTRKTSTTTRSSSGAIQPDLAAGNPTGYDIITPSDWMVERLIRLGYLQPLDKSLLPNFEANAQDLFKRPVVRPGQRVLACRGRRASSASATTRR